MIICSRLALTGQEAATRAIVLLRVAILVVAALVCPDSRAADPEIIEMKAGETADAYFSINIKGKVFVKIAAKPGDEACADFWWIKWPWGTIEQLGHHCNGASFEIPSLFAFTLSSKLRVGGTKNTVKMAVSATEQVAYSHTFTF